MLYVPIFSLFPVNLGDVLSVRIWWDGQKYGGMHYTCIYSFCQSVYDVMCVCDNHTCM